MYKLLNGKELSQKIKDDLKNKISDFCEKYDKTITLAVVMVGENPASKIYINNKIKACEYVGIKSLSYCLPESSSQNDVENLIKTLANDILVDGILLQLPLPKNLDSDKILNLIPPEKDVDGFSAQNVGNLLLGKDCIVSCTPKGIISLLKSDNIELSGKNAVIVGRSNIVGKPISLLLLKENCTVTICHSKTVGLKSICAKADIIIAALGKACFITSDMVKEGAIIVDVGINRTENGLKGDVDFDNVAPKCSFITPVPGGVGPMTIASLMENTYECALKRVK